MDHLGRKITRRADGQIGFICPACNVLHLVPTTGPRRWLFNNDGDRPTMTPAIIYEQGETFCHSLVSDGEITFFQDSFHHLAGQTVALPDIMSAEMV